MSSEEKSVMSLVIVYRTDIPVIESGKFGLQGSGLVVADFQGKSALQVSTHLIDQAQKQFEPADTSVQSEYGIMTHFARKARDLFGCDIWEVRHDQIKRAFHVIKEVTQGKLHPLGQSETAGVLSCKGQ